MAIVGENGVGKSTLVKLILRLYDTTEGSIRSNGKALTEYNIADLRNRIGVAFQNSHIYAFSVRENTGLYKEAEDEQINHTLTSLDLSNIVKMEKGLDAQRMREFDENGIMMSGGEVQNMK